MISVIYLLIAIISSASMAVVLKLFRNTAGNRYGIIIGNYLTCVIISAITLFIQSKPFRASSVTGLCGVAGGVLFVAGLVGMQSSVRKNGAILTSAFSKLGLVIPLFVSVLFFGEAVRLIQIPGILMVLSAFFLISFDSGKTDAFCGAYRTLVRFQTDIMRSKTDSGKTETEAKETQHVYPLLLLAVLFFCGGGDAMAKVFDEVGESDQNGMYFLILFSVTALLTLILFLIEKKKTGKRLVWKEFAAGILVGIPNYFSSMFLLLSLNGLPAFVVYPAFSAGTLVLVTLIATLIFRERPGMKTWIGIGLIAAALILLSI